MKIPMKEYIREVFMVLLLSSLVILTNVMIGWSVIMYLYSFYLAVFFFLFVPVWLIAFGTVFQPKWKWYSMISGSFLAVLLLCFTFFSTGEGLTFRFVNALILSILGSISVLCGWVMRKLAHSIRQDFSNKRGKQRSNEQPTSLGM